MTNLVPLDPANALSILGSLAVPKSLAPFWTWITQCVAGEFADPTRIPGVLSSLESGFCDPVRHVIDAVLTYPTLCPPEGFDSVVYPGVYKLPGTNPPTPVTDLMVVTLIDLSCRKGQPIAEWFNEPPDAVLWFDVLPQFAALERRKQGVLPQFDRAVLHGTPDGFGQFQTRVATAATSRFADF